MLYNIKLTLEYDGTHYHGWQKQKNLPTIQGTLERVISGIVKESTKVIGASRTDAGVHAIGQIVNFKSKLKLPESSWVKAINSILPDDIVVKQAEYVPLEFHARYSARKKVYQYMILSTPSPSPFLRNYAWHIRHPLNMASMIEASRHLIGTKDFSSFRASECSAKSPVRTLDRLEIRMIDTSTFLFVKKEGLPIISITFEAQSFLQHMVRNIVGTLKEVGEGKISPSHVEYILEQRDRRHAGPIAPSRGLFLVEIRY